MTTQLDLFSAVMHAYNAEHAGQLANTALYDTVANLAGVCAHDMARREPVGQSGQPHNLIKRKIRWWQQSLKHWGVLDRVDGERGVWALTHPTRKGLSQIKPGVSVVGFSTALGVAILGSCDSVFAHVDAPVVLSIMSSPYPLAKERAYGNVSEAHFVDWICRTLEPVVKCLVDGASVCLNVSQDIFMPGLPERSMYCERLLLALHDRLGLRLVDRLIWENTSRQPGPTQWACIKRVQLRHAYEPVYWMTNNPLALRTDNRRVLQAHTERHLKLMQSGGEKREGVYCDGAHRIRQGSFSNPTQGSIAKNILKFSHTCADQRAYKARARAMGLPAHGAPMPLSLASFLVEFMSQEGETVIDPFAGSFTTAVAAQRLGRRWIATDNVLQYVIGAATRFEDEDGFEQRLAA